MKKTLITTTLFLACSGVFAQALSEKDLQEIQSSFKKDASTKAIQNILTADKDIKGNALNRDLQGKIDHYFKYRADVKGITNQLSSGRCWMFTSMNVLRPSIMKKYNLSQFDFSHNYLYFWDIFEKSNLFLENIIATAKQPTDSSGILQSSCRRRRSMEPLLQCCREIRSSASGSDARNRSFQQYFPDGEHHQ